MTKSDLPPPIASLAEIEALYARVKPAAKDKVIHRLMPEHRKFIEQAPLAVLATNGAQNLDCSPRGDEGGAIHILDDKTLALPDRPGNNRIDALRNILNDNRVALWCTVPGTITSLKIKGRASIAADPEWCQRFAMQGKTPATVILVAIEEVYIQCGRALLRSKLWEPQTWPNPEDVPTQGTMLAEATGGRAGGAEYDKAWPDRARQGLY